MIFILHFVSVVYHSDVQITNQTNFFFFFCFLGPHSQHMEVPRLGVKSELQRWPMPQSQQHGTQASSLTYTTAHGNARSLTHCMRPGIEPATSQFLVGLISTVPWWELLKFITFVVEIICYQGTFNILF